MSSFGSNFVLVFVMILRQLGFAFLCPIVSTFVTILRPPGVELRLGFTVCYAFATTMSSRAIGHALFDFLFVSLFEFAIAIFDF